MEIGRQPPPASEMFPHQHPRSIPRIPPLIPPFSRANLHPRALLNPRSYRPPACHGRRAERHPVRNSIDQYNQ